MSTESDAGLLAHELRGAGGEVILLLNGGMMTYPAWTPIADRLIEDQRVLGCDFRGQLLSPGEAPAELIDHVPDIVALLDALALDRVHVLGTSFGAKIAVLLAALHPERVRTLAAVTAADRTPPGMRENSRALSAAAREVLAGGDPEAFFDGFIEDVYSPAWRAANAGDLAARRARTAELPRSWYRGLIGILKSIEDFDLATWLGQIRCPTLVVHAAADAVMPEDRVRALAASIAGAELRVHPAAGHALVAEDPLWLADVYRDFLARRAGGS